MKRNVLLVETNSDNPTTSEMYPPLALMKISTYHKMQGDNVKYVRGFNFFDTFQPDIIYITTLFTWDFERTVTVIMQYKRKFPHIDIKVGGLLATLMSNEIEKETGIKPFIGIWGEVENLKLDYGIAEQWAKENKVDIDYSIVFATRGCIRKCPWCMVWRHDGELTINKDWENMVNIKHKRIVFWDNNFFACYTKGGEYKEFMFDVLKQLHRMHKNGWINSIDFNQGLDARLFTDEIAEAMKGLPMHPLRFAFDSLMADKFIQDAINRAFKYKLKDIAVYMLFNFNETPEEIYYRIKEMAKLGPSVMTFMMKYQPLDVYRKGDYIGKYWTKLMIENFRQLRNDRFVNGILRFNSVEHFENIFGKTDKEFVEKLNKGKDIQEKRVAMLNNFINGKGKL